VNAFLTTPMAHMARMANMALTCDNPKRGG
jgi:hypothetical protein